MKYKLRAECLLDVKQFIKQNEKIISNARIISIEDYPDVILVFNSQLKFSEIIDLLRLIDDSHVMIQTIKPANEYTGDRDYHLY